HVGHVALLEAARAEGEALVVGVNSDTSVRRLEKGTDRPLVPEGERARLLAALASVDCVVVFDEETPLALIQRLRPDVLVKGADYARRAIVGADQVEGWGGRVVRVPLVKGASTTQLLERLAGVPDEQRTARYRCVVAYLDTPLAKPQLVEATCEGRILSQARGSGGFGYDPLFLSSDLGMTFAEAPLPAKQRVSHRGRAIRALVEVLLRRSR